MKSHTTIVAPLAVFYLLPIWIAIWVAIVRAFGLPTAKAISAIVLSFVFDFVLGVTCAKLFPAPSSGRSDDSDDDIPPAITGATP